MITFTDNILDSAFIEKAETYKQKINELGSLKAVADGSLYELLKKA